MIVSIETVLALPEFSGSAASVVMIKIKAIESAIRAYTNNRFQVRDVRFFAESKDGILLNANGFIAAGDTVEISDSGINDGLYIVESATATTTVLDRPIFDDPYNVVTLIHYPEDVQMGALNLIVWDANNRQKIGISSETLSRHSISYFDQSAANTMLGYPIALLGFLKPYRKART